MAEEEVLKTFQCGFESHRGHAQNSGSITRDAVQARFQAREA